MTRLSYFTTPIIDGLLMREVKFIVNKFRIILAEAWGSSLFDWWSIVPAIIPRSASLNYMSYIQYRTLCLFCPASFISDFNLVPVVTLVAGFPCVMRTNSGTTNSSVRLGSPWKSSSPTRPRTSTTAWRSSCLWVNPNHSTQCLRPFAIVFCWNF